MSGLFSPKMPAPPPPAAPAPMPDSNSPAVLEAKRKAEMEAASRAGRASTILTGSGSGTPAANRGNSDSYGGNKLGGG